MAQMEMLMARMMSDVAKKEDVQLIATELQTVKSSVNKIENRVDSVEADIHNLKIEMAKMKQNAHSPSSAGPDTRRSVGGDSRLLLTRTSRAAARIGAEDHSHERMESMGHQRGKPNLTRKGQELEEELGEGLAARIPTPTTMDHSVHDEPQSQLRTSRSRIRRGE